MTNEQFAEIKKKIERANEIVATLEKLENADPFKSGRIARFFDGSTQSAVLDDELLKKVIFYGIDFMTSMLSTELASIEINKVMDEAMFANYAAGGRVAGRSRTASRRTQRTLGGLLNER